LSFDHAAFSPYQSLVQALALAAGMPSLDRLNALAASRGAVQARGLPLRFMVPPHRLSARAYETHILETGEVPTRTDTWHDILNALVWLRFPRFKAALNLAHNQAIAGETDPLRGRRRDAMTVLDESGVWLISQGETLPRLLAARAWQSLFWDHRSAVESTMHFVVVGHAVLEKALAPYPSITGKCLTLVSSTLDPDAVESEAATALDTLESPRQLAPLPIQGIPGWDVANSHAGYYANEAIFRPARKLPG
jgi:hypothetical protein